MSGPRSYLPPALDRGPANGYDIGKEIEERSEARHDPFTVAAAKRLTTNGVVEAVAAPAGETGEPRWKHFGITLGAAASWRVKCNESML